MLTHWPPFKEIISIKGWQLSGESPAFSIRNRRKWGGTPGVKTDFFV